MTETKEMNSVFPVEVSRVSEKAIRHLRQSGYFNSEFSNPEEAARLFHYRLSESLLPKFISGDEMEWESNELDTVVAKASVEQAVCELEAEGTVHRFDDVVVLANVLK